MLELAAWHLGKQELQNHEPCLTFTDVVKYGETRDLSEMTAKRRENDKRKHRAQGAAQVRATISFPPQIYETLEGIAKEKKVSLAWVVREAAEKYIGDMWPLFKRAE